MTVRQIEFKLYHQNCAMTKVSEKFPELHIEALSAVAVVEHKKCGIVYQALWGIDGDSTSQLNACIEFIKSMPETVHFEIVKRGDFGFVAVIVSKSGTSSYEEIIKHNAIYYGNPSIHDGYELHNLIIIEPENTAKTLKELEEIGELHIKRIGSFKPTKKMARLSDKQLEALKLALKNGYYSWPRKATLEELALAGNISRRALHERLRRAEAKLIPKLIANFIERQTE